MTTLMPGFAASFSGVDGARPTAGDIAALKAAMIDHPVIVLPDQHLSVEQQIAFARQFGPIHVNVLAAKSYTPGVRAEVLEVSNIAGEGKIMSPDDRRRLLDLGNMMWHTDSSFEEVPCHLSMLYGIKVTKEGGETQFADLRAGYDALSDRWKAVIEDMVAVHSPMHSRTMMGFEYQAADHAMLGQTVRHKVVRTSPDTGRKSLYLASHASHIVGMSVPEGRMILSELTELATRPDHVYTHRWRPNDLVIWNNLCTMHRLRRYDASGEQRLLRRVSTIHPDSDSHARTDAVSDRVEAQSY